MKEILIISLMILMIVGSFSLGYCWGFVSGENKWLKFIDKKVVRVNTISDT